MAIRNSSPQIRTRLQPEDMKAFRQLAYAKNMSLGALVREAVLAYLEADRRKHVIAHETPLAHEMRASTNRICSLLAKVAIDARAIFRFLGELEDSVDMMVQCRAEAAADISRALERRVLP